MSQHNIQHEITNYLAATGTPIDFGAVGIKADVIAESTSATGVTADGVLMKDTTVTLGSTTTSEADTQIVEGVTATAAELSRSSDMSARVVTLSTTPISITEAAHDGRIMYITKTDGIAITLPVPAAGMMFTFIVGATIASASTIKSVAGTQIMIGHAIMGNDSDNTTVRWPAIASSTYDTINLLGTGNSTGGIEGQVIRILGLSATLWWVEIVGDAAGTEATPFENTVT